MFTSAAAVALRAERPAPVPVVAAAGVDTGAVTRTACPSGEVGIESGGLRRRYVVTRDGSTARRAPILLLFHGYTGSPETVTDASRLPAAAAARGWVVVAPQGAGSPSRWALQSLPAPDDVAFVRDVIADVARDGCADSSRVAAVGYSNGAGFTAVLTCRLHLVASAMVSGANLGPTCDVSDRYPMVIAHGESDPVVPVKGGDVIGGALHARPLDGAIADWRAAGADVHEVLVPGWDHGWVPGATEAILASFATVAA